MTHAYAACADWLTFYKSFTSSKNFPKTKKNEYYVKDLVGCNIQLIDGKKIGKVIDVENFGAGDLLEISFKKNKIYIPMNKDNLISVDIIKQLIVVNPIKGIIN